MKKKSLFVPFLVVLGLIFLTCCTSNLITPTLSPTITPTASPTIIPTAVENPNFPGLEPITSENINRLEIIDQLGVGRIFDFAISPDQKTLAVYTPMKIYLYDTASLTEKGVLNTEYPMNIDQYQTESIAFSPDGNNLYYSSQTILRRMNITTKEITYFVSQIPDWDITNIEIMPDNLHFIITTQGYYSSCDSIGINYALYDLYGNQLFNRYSCAAYTINFYKIIENKLIIVFSSIMTDIYPLEVYVVNIEDGFLLASSIPNFSDKHEYFEKISGNENFLPSNEQLVSWKDEYESLINPPDLPCDLEHIGHPEYTLVFQNEYQYLYLVKQYLYSNRLELWNVQGCSLVNTVSYPISDTVVFDPSGRFIASSNGVDTTIWDISTSKNKLTIFGGSVQQPIDFMAFNNNGTRLFTGSQNVINWEKAPGYLISIWDTSTGFKLGELISQNNDLLSIISTPNNEIIMAVDDAGSSFWNIMIYQKLATLPKGKYAFDATGDNIWIATENGEENRTLRKYNYSTGIEIDNLPLFPNTISAIEINEDNSKMLINYYYPRHISDGYALIDLQTKEFIWSKEKGMSGGEIDFDNLINNFAYFDDGYSDWNFDQLISEKRYSGYWVGHISNMDITEKDNSLYFWDSNSGNYLAEIDFTQTIVEIIPSPESYHIALKDTNGLVFLLGVKKE